MLDLRETRTCRYIRHLSKMYYMSCTGFLAARFFDTFCIQYIFYYKLPCQRLGSIIKYSFHRGPPPPPACNNDLSRYMQSNNLDEVNKILNMRRASAATSRTVYTEYAGLFRVSLLCFCVFSSATLWNQSRAEIRPLIICFDRNAWREEGNILLSRDTITVMRRRAVCLFRINLSGQH